MTEQEPRVKDGRCNECNRKKLYSVDCRDKTYFAVCTSTVLSRDVNMHIYNTYFRLVELLFF